MSETRAGLGVRVSDASDAIMEGGNQVVVVAPNVDASNPQPPLENVSDSNPPEPPAAGGEGGAGDVDLQGVELAGGAADAGPGSQDTSPATASEPTQTQPDDVATETVQEAAIQELIAHNILPADVDVSKLSGEKDIIEAIRLHAVEPLRQAIRAEIENEYLNAGVDPNHLAVVSAISLGLTREDVERKQFVSYLAQVEPMEGKEDEFAESYFYTYYQDKNLSEEESKRLAKVDMAAENRDELLEQRRSYFKDLEVKINDDHQQKMKAKAQERESTRQKHLAEINKITSGTKLGDSIYTPEQMKQLRTAVLNPTEKFIDAEGRERKITLYESLRMKKLQSVEGELELAAMLLFGTKPQEVVQASTNQNNNRLINRLNSAVSGTPGVQAATTKSTFASALGQRV